MSTSDMKRSVQAMAAYARNEWAEPAAEKIPGNGGPVQRAAQTGTIISLVVIAVVALVGVLILSRVNDALPDVQNEELSNASTSVLSGFSSAMELVPVVMIVLVSALVIGVVQRIRG